MKATTLSFTAGILAFSIASLYLTACSKSNNPGNTDTIAETAFNTSAASDGEAEAITPM